jgi:hypothetical protein
MKNYLNRLVEETIAPTRAAIAQFKEEICETLEIPTSPWKILNKPWDALSNEEIQALYDIYHEPEETEPCPMCKWATRMEVTEINKGRKHNGI